eukprot:scaffold84244_cov33-Tisochrysis_lutea.AAC.1
MESPFGEECPVTSMACTFRVTSARLPRRMTANRLAGCVKCGLSIAKKTDNVVIILTAESRRRSAR